jgi:aminoglycoside phosphotransferase (APT) family kinase protein
MTKGWSAAGSRAQRNAARVLESPSGEIPDAAWLKDRLASCIWRDDESAGRVIDFRVRQKRQSRHGTTTFCALDLSGADGRTVEQLYLLHQMGVEDFDTETESHVADATIVPALGRAVTAIPEAGLLLVAFPNDPKMRLVTEESLRAWLSRRATTLANRGRRGPRWRLAESFVDVLRYAPGQRLTVRCRGCFVATGGAEQPFGLIAKQFRKRKGAEELYGNLVALDRHASMTGAVRLPRPVALDKESGLVVMEEMPGTDLKRALGSVDLMKTMQAAGAILAAFHQAPRRVSASVTVLKELDEVRHAAQSIERFFPTAIPRLQACLSRCLAAQWSDDVPTVLLHGAYRPKHVWVHEGQLALIDVDGIRMGHPAYDIGHFLSALYYLETQGHFSASDRRGAARRFIEGYVASAPWRLRPAGVLWFVAALLVHKQARKYVMHLHDDRAEKVDRVLKLSERALAACEGLGPEAPLDAIWDILD